MAEGLSDSSERHICEGHIYPSGRKLKAEKEMQKVVSRLQHLKVKDRIHNGARRLQSASHSTGAAGVLNNVGRCIESHSQLGKHLKTDSVFYNTYTYNTYN